MAGNKSNAEWEEAFKKADKDNSGSLDKAELTALLKKGNSKLRDSDINNVFKYFDGPDGDSKISLNEFLNGLNKIRLFIEEMKFIFYNYDADKSGCLDKNELKKILHESGRKFSESDICQILKEMDTSGDGKISFDEFICLFT